MALTTSEESLRWQLYNQGLSDREIAQRVGITASVVGEWRKRRHLPINSLRGRNTDQEMYERRLKLYNQKLTDKQIADLEGVSEQAIRTWRKVHGLPAHRQTCAPMPRGVPMEQALTPEQCEVMRDFLNDLARCAIRRPDLRIDALMFAREWCKQRLEVLAG